MQITGQRSFWVADLNSEGELQLKAEYRYDQLEAIPGALDLIVHFATLLWRTPDGFETRVPGEGRGLSLRWLASAPSAGIVTLRCQSVLASLSLLASGQNPTADMLTLQAFQRHLVAELRDTGFEPAFGLLDLTERPLVATVNFSAPPTAADRMTVALADRCFAAAYFRCRDLA